MDESQLKDDVRQQTGYTSQAQLSTNALDTAYRNAQRHIRIRRGLDAGVDWFDSDFPEREEALYWWTCLFSKLATGEIDSQDIQIGAVSIDSLLASEGDDEVLTWLRNARTAMSAVNATGRFRLTSVQRDNRVYEDGDSTSGDLLDGL